MVEHFWEYVAWHRGECTDLSVAHDELQYFEEEGSHGGRGLVHGDLSMSGDFDAYLKVKEVIAIGEGHDHREEYAYYLIVNGVELWGRERDPSHVGEEVHLHRPRTASGSLLRSSRSATRWRRAGRTWRTSPSSDLGTSTTRSRPDRADGAV